MDSCVDFDPLEFSSDEYQYPPKPMASRTVSVTNIVESLVHNNKIVIFSKSSCPHCKDSKSLFEEKGVGYMAVELDKMKDGSLVQSTLGEMTDARTVPRIFINGQCVGGNSDLKSLEQTGELKGLLHEGQSKGGEERRH